MPVIPVLRGQVELCKFKASLVYRAISGAARASERAPVSKTKTKKKPPTLGAYNTLRLSHTFRRKSWANKSWRRISLNKNIVFLKVSTQPIFHFYLAFKDTAALFSFQIRGSRFLSLPQTPFLLFAVGRGVLVGLVISHRLFTETGSLAEPCACQPV